ncbi:MAG: hypothetical protein AAGH74_07715 [Pseudomonadota bacterium]
MDRDYAAVMESAAEIKAAFPQFTWPEGLTREDNLVDLGWHQREFTARRSFAWIIEDHGGQYLGCAYVYPSIEGDQGADVWWWWRTGIEVDRPAFRELFEAWLAGPLWPALAYRTMV